MHAAMQLFHNLVDSSAAETWRHKSR